MDEVDSEGVVGGMSVGERRGDVNRCSVLWKGDVEVGFLGAPVVIV